MKLTFPNILSLLRVVIAPFFLWFIVSENEYLVVSSFWLFVIGGLTDYFDGWLARKYNLITSSGKFLDPLADKILTTSAFVGFILLAIVPLWMVVLILLRDIGTTALRLIAESRRMHVKTSRVAQYKTFIQMFFIWAILLLIYFRTTGIFPLTFEFYNSIIYSEITYIIMLLITLLSVYTLIDYLWSNKALFSIKKKAISK